MKRNTYRLLIGISCLCVLNACDITEMPYNYVTDDELVSDASSVEAVTLGNYSYMKEHLYHTAIEYNGELGSDNVCISGQSTSSLFYIYNYQRIATNSILTDLWTYPYKTIVNCNSVINTTREGENPELDHLLGENYLIRAWCYHQLTNAFGKAYHIASDSDLSVPLKLTADKDDYPDRATVKQVYEQIVKDLSKAESLMESSGIEKNACYGNVWAAKALLSRVYLYMHDYENAEKYATDVIEHSGKTLLTNSQYATMNELVPENNPEAIWAIRMLKDLDYDKANSAVMYTTIKGEGWGEIYASLPLIEAFRKYPSDVRATFIVPQYVEPLEDGTIPQEICFVSENHFYNNSATPTDDPLHRTYFRFQPVKKVGSDYVLQLDNTKDKFEYRDPKVQMHPDGSYYVVARQVFRDNTSAITGRANWKEYIVTIQNEMLKRNDYPKYFINKCANQEQQPMLNSPMLVRLSEMYLNRAEARHYQNNDDGAIRDMNIIKERAGIPTYNETVDGDILDAILDERRKELYVESQRRWDLFRNNKVIDRHYPGCHDRGAENMVVQEIRVTDNCAVQYLPQSELDAYPFPLQQNP